MNAGYGNGTASGAGAVSQASTGPQIAPRRLSSPPGRGREDSLGMRFVLAMPDGRQYALVIDARRALIGSGAHCEVRLDQDMASPEHIEAVLDNGIIHLRALSAEPVALMNGVGFSQGAWPAGGILSIGLVRIAAETIDLSDKKKRTNPFLLLALVPVFAVVGVLAYIQARPTPPVVFPAPPALFDPPVTRCPPHASAPAATRRTPTPTDLPLPCCVARRRRSTASAALVSSTPFSKATSTRWTTRPGFSVP